MDVKVSLFWSAYRIERPTEEYRFAAIDVGEGKGLRARLAAAGLKDWRFDFAWPRLKVAMEIEGGAWSNGRHTRGSGFAADLRKYQAAMVRGWTIYRCDYAMLKSGEAYEAIKRILEIAAGAAVGRGEVSHAMSTEYAPMSAGAQGG